MTEKATIKTLLVDDEYLALNLLENFVHQVPGLEIVAKVKSPMHQDTSSDMCKCRKSEMTQEMDNDYVDNT